MCDGFSDTGIICEILRPCSFLSVGVEACESLLTLSQSLIMSHDRGDIFGKSVGVYHERMENRYLVGGDSLPVISTE